MKRKNFIRGLRRLRGCDCVSNPRNPRNPRIGPFALILTVSTLLAASSCFLIAGGVAAKGASLDGSQQAPAPSPKGIDPKLVKQFPEGEGKEIVLAACVQCHGLGEIVSHRMDSKGWEKAILDMVAKGTQLLPGESETLVQYLAANFAPLLNMNSATAAELAGLPSVDKALAAAIVRHRQKNGPFKDIQDVSRVEGLSPQVFERIKGRITTGPTSDVEKKK